MQPSDAQGLPWAQVKEAEEHAEADKVAKEIAHARNDAESLVHNTEKSVDEHKMKIPAEVQNQIREAIKELQEALGKQSSPRTQSKVFSARCLP